MRRGRSFSIGQKMIEEVRVRANPQQRDTNGIRVSAATLLSVVEQQGLNHIDALKIDIEGSEDDVLAPYFRDAPSRIWPNLIIIEDASGTWRTDLFSLFKAKGYLLVARSKLNAIYRRSD